VHGVLTQQAQGAFPPLQDISLFGMGKELLGALIFGIASLTGYEGEEPRISGMDVNYPDQIVSLFATGIVITAVMEARRSGKGAWITVYTNPGHAYMVIAGLRFDTSGQGRAGTRWQDEPRSTAGFAMRHIPGL
jgi:hypothetical protein